MRLLLASLALLPLAVACATEPDHTDDSKLPATAPTSSATATGPRIRGFAWTWHGCGPSASPLPLSMIVHVDVLSVDADYSIKGHAVACDPFEGNDQLSICHASPAAVVRLLSVTVADSNGSDTESAGTVDCVDGKAVFIP